MKKLVAFNLQQFNYRTDIYTLSTLYRCESNRHFSHFFSTEDLDHYFAVSNCGYVIYSVDNGSGDINLLAAFYHLNKNFLYGECMLSGKCLYGILGSTMHRKFSSTDLLLIKSDLSFSDLQNRDKYPEFSIDRTGWQRAFYEKNELISSETQLRFVFNAADQVFQY